MGLPTRIYKISCGWILYQKPITTAPTIGTVHLTPSFAAVIDVRSSNWSSDHFPVFTLLEVKLKL